MAAAGTGPAQAVHSHITTIERPLAALAAFSPGSSVAGQSHTHVASEALSADPVAAKNKWELIIEAVKRAGTWVLDKLSSAAKQGYDAFKRAYDSLPSPVRKILPYAYDIYQAICAVFGC